jgi:hypothetical protein
MGTGAFQMQACDHEGVPSCERGPQGAEWLWLLCHRISCTVTFVWKSMCVCNEDLCVLFFTQGGGGKDDDYVTRIEFRLLLVSLTTVLSAM